MVNISESIFMKLKLIFGAVFAIIMRRFKFVSILLSYAIDRDSCETVGDKRLRFITLNYSNECSVLQS